MKFGIKTGILRRKVKSSKISDNKLKVDRYIPKVKEEVKKSVKIVEVKQDELPPFEAKLKGSNIEIKYNDPKSGPKMIPLSIQAAISGCGLYIIQGVTYDKVACKIIAAACKEVFSVKLPAGGVIATLGDFYKQYVPNLIEAGFKKIHTIQNLAHSAPATQDIFILDIPRKPMKIV